MCAHRGVPYPHPHVDADSIGHGDADVHVYVHAYTHPDTYPQRHGIDINADAHSVVYSHADPGDKHPLANLNRGFGSER